MTEYEYAMLYRIPIEAARSQRAFAESAEQIIRTTPSFESYYRDFIHVDGVRYRIYIQRDLNVAEIPR